MPMKERTATPVWRVWALRVLVSAALSPIPGVILSIWLPQLNSAHPAVDWSHPLYLIGGTIGAIVFVYMSGGRSYDFVTGFHPMYGWLALGTVINLILLCRPWRGRHLAKLSR